MKKHRFYCILLFLLVFSSSFAQQKLTVFRVVGTIEVGKDKLLQKGQYIVQKDKVTLAKGDEAQFIDKDGVLYEVDEAGSYRLGDIVKNPKKTNQTSMTKKYLRYVYSSFMNKEEKKTVHGGVYRGDAPMLSPPDSAEVVWSKITLKWEKNEVEGLLYLFVKNASQEVLKIETNGSQLAFHRGNPFFAFGETYQWAVTNNPFPNLDNLPFYQFTLIDKVGYKEKKKQYISFVDDLSSMGLSENEIEEALCEMHGLCK